MGLSFLQAVQAVGVGYAHKESYRGDNNGGDKKPRNHGRRLEIGEESKEQKNKRAKAVKFFMQGVCSLRRRKNGEDPEEWEKMMNLRCFLSG